MYNRKDAFYHRAKESGFRSRAAFKLIELAKAERLLHPGDRVVDLGAWPGAWLQVAAQLVGKRGCVVGVDRRPIQDLEGDHVHCLEGDVFDPQTADRVWALCDGVADVILSDLAPSLTGIRAKDEAECARLLDATLGYVARGLKPGGSLLVKVFMGGEFSASQARLKRAFRRLRIIRPDATRKGSAELYALGRDYAGTLGDENLVSAKD